MNLAPSYFADPFTPEVDAVYLVYAEEIRRHLGTEIEFLSLDAALLAYLRINRFIFLHGRKMVGCPTVGSR